MADFVSGPWRLAKCALCLVLLWGCGAAAGDPRRTPLRCGDAVVLVEVADDPAERAQGLMMRREMAEDHGMLFVFDEAGRQSFWMHNTLIPLSIAYLGEGGEVLEIHDMFPLDRSAVASESGAVRYALEVNRGWFQRRGIKAGDRFDMGAVAGRAAR
ncbi:MAG: DUF192 domain-containing protein [Verrucomicrobiae bacterium]|nr:DUF192 domain-containing protein [Verrucomicrobiae bacterium]